MARRASQNRRGGVLKPFLSRFVNRVIAKITAANLDQWVSVIHRWTAEKARLKNRDFRAQHNSFQYRLTHTINQVMKSDRVCRSRIHHHKRSSTRSTVHRTYVFNTIIIFTFSVFMPLIRMGRFNDLIPRSSEPFDGKHHPRILRVAHDNTLPVYPFVLFSLITLQYARSHGNRRLF